MIATNLFPCCAKRKKWWENTPQRITERQSTPLRMHNSSRIGHEMRYSPNALTQPLFIKFDETERQARRRRPEDQFKSAHMGIMERSLEPAHGPENTFHKYFFESRLGPYLSPYGCHTRDQDIMNADTHEKAVINQGFVPGHKHAPPLIPATAQILDLHVLDCVFVLRGLMSELQPFITFGKRQLWKQTLSQAMGDIPPHPNCRAPDLHTTMTSDKQVSEVFVKWYKNTSTIPGGNNKPFEAPLEKALSDHSAPTLLKAVPK